MGPGEPRLMDMSRTNKPVRVYNLELDRRGLPDNRKTAFIMGGERELERVIDWCERNKVAWYVDAPEFEKYNQALEDVIKSCEKRLIAMSGAKFRQGKGLPG